MTLAGTVVEAPVGGFERGLYRPVFVLVCVSSVSLLLYLLSFVASARAGPWPEMGLLLLVVGLLGVPFSLWGFFAANALLLFLWGSLVGVGTAARRARVREPLESIAPPIHEPAGAAVAGR